MLSIAALISATLLNTIGGWSDYSATITNDTAEPVAVVWLEVPQAVPEDAALPEGWRVDQMSPGLAYWATADEFNLPTGGVQTFYFAAPTITEFDWQVLMVSGNEIDDMVDVPEPCTLALLGLGAMMMKRRA